MRRSSAPAVAERSGWRSRRAGRLPGRASAYAAAVGLAAAAATVVSVVDSAPTQSEWTSFLLLFPLAALAPRFRVAVGRNHSLHTGPAFIVAGALVLPPALLVALVVALHLPVVSNDQTPWYIKGFNLSNSTLNALAAWVVVDAIGTGSDASFALAGLLAAAVFVASNHLLLAIMLRLGRGHTFRESGLFSATGLGIEFVHRRARRCGRRVRRVQSLAPAHPDRTARARPPLTLHRRAAARERGAVPDDVRVRADGDDACRRRRLGDGREPLARSAPGLHRGGVPPTDARRPRASGRPREWRRKVRGAGSRRPGHLPARGAVRDEGRTHRDRAPRGRTRPRRGRQAVVRDRDGRGRDRAEATRGAAAAEPEARGDRPARRRRRARLQQHADGDRRLHGVRARARRHRLVAPLGSGRDPQGDRPSRTAHPAAARVQPQAGAEARDPEPERDRRRARDDAATDDRRGHRHDHAPRSSPRPDRSRPGPAPPGRDEPRRQRARRDAGGRRALDRDRERRHRWTKARTRSHPAATSR